MRQAAEITQTHIPPEAHVTLSMQKILFPSKGGHELLALVHYA